MSEMRLIDANALAEYMGEKVKNLAKEYSWHDHYVTGFDDALSYVDCAPTIDAVPVVHGRWELENGWWKCSACREFADGSFKYCPNCGAKMDAKEG